MSTKDLGSGCSATIGRGKLVLGFTDPETVGWILEHLPSDDGLTNAIRETADRAWSFAVLGALEAS